MAPEIDIKWERSSTDELSRVRKWLNQQVETGAARRISQGNYGKIWTKYDPFLLSGLSNGWNEVYTLDGEPLVICHDWSVIEGGLGKTRLIISEKTQEELMRQGGLARVISGEESN